MSIRISVKKKAGKWYATAYTEARDIFMCIPSDTIIEAIARLLYRLRKI